MPRQKIGPMSMETNTVRLERKNMSETANAVRSGCARAIAQTRVQVRRALAQGRPFG
jgi:hypothetical protein